MICLSTDDFTPEEICYTGLLESTALSVPVLLVVAGLGWVRAIWCDTWHRNELLLDPSLCSPVPNTVLACAQQHLSNGGMAGTIAAAWCIIMTLRGMGGQRPECWRRRIFSPPYEEPTL